MAVAYAPRFTFESQTLMKKWSFAIFCSFISALATALNENVGPKFPEDLPPTFAYSNLVGGKFLCKAVGEPKPSIQWLTADFFPVPNITSVRQVSPESLFCSLFSSVSSLYCTRLQHRSILFSFGAKAQASKGLNFALFLPKIHASKRRFSGNLSRNARKWNVIFAG